MSIAWGRRAEDHRMFFVKLTFIFSLQDSGKHTSEWLFSLYKVVSTFVFMLMRSKRTLGSARQSKADDADKMFDLVL